MALTPAICRSQVVIQPTDEFGLYDSTPPSADLTYRDELAGDLPNEKDYQFSDWLRLSSSNTGQAAPTGDGIGSTESAPQTARSSDDMMANVVSSGERRPNSSSSGSPSYEGMESDLSQRSRYFEADYLLWWSEPSRLPPLLTTNPVGTPLDQAGPLDSPGNRVVMGNDKVGDWPHSGLRLRYGQHLQNGWLSRWELGVWHLFQNQTELLGGSDDATNTNSSVLPIFSRPFFNSALGEPDAQVLSFPGVVSGRFGTDYDRQAIGADPLLFLCLSSNRCQSWEFFSGYRFLWLTDKLVMTEQVQLLNDPLAAPGTGFRVQDSFRASNAFHTIPLGLSFVNRTDRWQVNARADMGLGFVNQVVKVRGLTQTLDGGDVTSSTDAGLMALHTNSGRHDRTRFAWVPQLSLNLERRMRRGWLTFGYTIISLNDVVKAVDHLPTAIDPDNLPPVIPGGGPDPRFQFREQSDLIHGFVVGYRLHF